MEMKSKGFSLGAAAKKAVTNEKPKSGDIDLEKIVVHAQVRTDFELDADFLASLKENGNTQSAIVERLSDGKYRLIAGERRYRGLKEVGRKTIFCHIYENLSDLERRKLQVQENIQRADLKPYELAMSVIDDHQKFGRETTIEIYGEQRESKGSWLSKILAAAKYKPHTMSLLQLNLVRDFELMNTLNKIESINSEAAKEIVDKFKNGEGYSRSEINSKYALMKERKEKEAQKRKEEAAAEEARKLAEFQAKQGDLIKVADDSQQVESNIAPTAAEQPADGIQSENIEPAATVVAPVNDEKTVKPVKQEKAKSASSPVAEESDKGQAALEAIKQIQSDFISWGEGVGLSVEKIAQNAGNVMSDSDADTILFTSFCDHVLPFLDAVGSKRTKILLEKIGGLLRKEKYNAGDVFKSLHDGKSLQDPVDSIDVPDPAKVSDAFKL